MRLIKEDEVLKNISRLTTADGKRVNPYPATRKEKPAELKPEEDKYLKAITNILGSMEKSERESKAFLDRLATVVQGMNERAVKVDVKMPEVKPVKLPTRWEFTVSGRDLNGYIKTIEAKVIE